MSEPTVTDFLKWKREAEQAIADTLYEFYHSLPPEVFIRNVKIPVIDTSTVDRKDSIPGEVKIEIGVS